MVKGMIMMIGNNMLIIVMVMTDDASKFSLSIDAGQCASLLSTIFKYYGDNCNYCDDCE